ncbi:MAG: sulfate/molybdate ABC transporter ATP-binding protein [Acidimicrobiia bacterium]
MERGTDFRLDVTISIAPGQTAALLGPNGAGKSTAVAAIAGIVSLVDGHIVLGGRTLDQPDTGRFVPIDRRGVGVVFQDYLLFPHMTVLENIAFGPRSAGIGRTLAREKARTWVDEVGLKDFESQKPGRLSGGQAQRVALARALAGEPEALLLDEPLAALDVTTRVQLRRLLAEHLDRFRGPRLLITHDPAEAFLLADLIYIIEDGLITQVGSADEIRLRPRTTYVADLAGANLFSGTAERGVVTVGRHLLHIADSKVAGEVLITIHPRVVALHLRVPEGSPRNVWETRVRTVERLGDRIRIHVDDPLPLTAEVTREAGDALSLEPGRSVWLSIKATEIGVESADAA